MDVVTARHDSSARPRKVTLMLSSGMPEELIFDRRTVLTLSGKALMSDT